MANQSLYECVVCKAQFTADARRVTGHTVEHCGTVARWLRNLSRYDYRYFRLGIGIEIIENHKGTIRQVAVFATSDEEKAKAYIKHLETRDKVQERIEDFIDEITSANAGVLDSDEIREMIQETAKP